MVKKKCSLKFYEQINKIGKRIEKEFKGKRKKIELKRLQKYTRSVCD